MPNFLDTMDIHCSLVLFFLTTIHKYNVLGTIGKFSLLSMTQIYSLIITHCTQITAGHLYQGLDQSPQFFNLKMKWENFQALIWKLKFPSIFTLSFSFFSSCSFDCKSTLRLSISISLAQVNVSSESSDFPQVWGVFLWFFLKIRNHWKWIVNSWVIGKN